MESTSSLFILLAAIEMIVILYLIGLVYSLRRRALQEVDVEVVTDDEQPVEPKVPKIPKTTRVIVSANEQQFLNRLKEVIFEEMIHGKIEIDTLADRMCISRSQLNRKVNALTGMSTSNYSIQLRLTHACKLLLEDTDTPISEIALHCGFEDAAYFTRIFKRRVGVPPTSYRKDADSVNADFGLKELQN